MKTRIPIDELLNAVGDAADMPPSRRKHAAVELAIAAVYDQYGEPAAAGSHAYVNALIDGQEGKAQALWELVVRYAESENEYEDQAPQGWRPRIRRAAWAGIHMLPLVLATYSMGLGLRWNVVFAIWVSASLLAYIYGYWVERRM